METPVLNPSEPSAPSETLVLQTQPAAPPQEAELNGAELARYDTYIEHNRYRNTVQIQGTQLLDCYQAVLPYCEEIHARSLQAFRTHLTSGKGGVSRTNHLQAYAVVRRYVDKIEDEGMRGRVLEALSQAERVEARAYWRVQEMAKERGQGNVKFVKVLSSGKGRRP